MKYYLGVIKRLTCVLIPIGLIYLLYSLHLSEETWIAIAYTTVVLCMLVLVVLCIYDTLRDAARSSSMLTIAWTIISVVIGVSVGTWYIINMPNEVTVVYLRWNGSVIMWIIISTIAGIVSWAIPITAIMIFEMLKFVVRWIIKGE